MLQSWGSRESLSFFPGSSCITIFHRTMMLPRGNKQQWRPSWPGASSDSIRLLKTRFWWQVNKRPSGKRDGREGGGAPSSFSLSYIRAGPPVVAAAKWLYILLWMMKHSFQRSWNWVWMFGLVVLFNLWFWKEPSVSVLVIIFNLIERSMWFWKMFFWFCRTSSGRDFGKHLLHGLVEE